jgi:dCTP deaminase
MSVLSKPEILKHYKAGNIIIDPFDNSNLSNTSYDVRLGKYFFRQTQVERIQAVNPFYEKSLRKMYSALEEAVPIKILRSKLNPFYNLKANDCVILLEPNETILAHTIEFIGGKNGIPGKLDAVTTEMRARSSLGRIGIAVCKCAGWGDIGYVNRWTMEITNFSNNVIPLPVGLRIAQIIFHSTVPVEVSDEYHLKGNSKYQAFGELKEIKKNWTPDDMLPKLYKDHDIGHFSKYNR